MLSKGDFVIYNESGVWWPAIVLDISKPAKDGGREHELYVSFASHGYSQTWSLPRRASYGQGFGQWLFKGEEPPPKARVIQRAPYLPEPEETPVEQDQEVV